MKLIPEFVFRSSRLLCLLLLALVFPVQAELPPFVYEQMKRDASDVVVVQILQAPKAGNAEQGKRQRIVYEANVLRVTRSKSRLKAGDAIVIQSHYYRFGPGEVGPSNPRRLKKNDIVLAYLGKGNKAGEFRIAAGGHSFEQPKPKREGVGGVAVPVNPPRVEPAPAPPIRVQPVEPAPPPHPEQPDVGPVFPGLPIGGEVIQMPMVPGMPGRFEIIPTRIHQNGRPVVVVLKIDTQTGRVWQLKATETKFFLNGKPQLRSTLGFEPIIEGPLPMHDRDREAPGRPAIGRGETEVSPEPPRRRNPRPAPVRPPRRGNERGATREATTGEATVTEVRQGDASTIDRPHATKDKANSSKVTGTVVTAASVKGYSGLVLELRLYEYHPLIADKPADLVAKLNLKNYAHKAGKETKTHFTIGENGGKKPGMAYYLTCFVIDRAGKRTLMGEKDGKRGLCKVLSAGNPNKVNLILRDLRK